MKGKDARVNYSATLLIVVASAFSCDDRWACCGGSKRGRDPRKFFYRLIAPPNILIFSLTIYRLSEILTALP